MHSMHPPKEDFPLRELLGHLAVDPRSSSEIARLSGVSQPTISRLRLSKGERLRRSGPFSKLCSFYGIRSVAGSGSSDYEHLLRDAIIEAWDGSEKQGHALLTVINGLKDLTDGGR